MTGKLGGHAGPVMTLLLRETNKESLVFTGSRDHYVKVRKLPDTDAKQQRPCVDERRFLSLNELCQKKENVESSVISR